MPELKEFEPKFRTQTDTDYYPEVEFECHSAASLYAMAIAMDSQGESRALVVRIKNGEVWFDAQFPCNVDATLDENGLDDG